MSIINLVFLLMILRPPIHTRTDTLFPYTTLFRSKAASICGLHVKRVGAPSQPQHLAPKDCVHASLIALALGFEPSKHIGVEPRRYLLLDRDRKSTRLNSSH